MLIANLDSGTMIVNVVDYPTTNKLVTMIRDLWGIERTKQVLTFTAAGPGGEFMNASHDLRKPAFLFLTF